MKAKVLLVTATLCLAGCSLIWSPTATVKKFIAGAEKGDVDTMTSLFSSKAIQKMSNEKIRSNNQNFSDMIRKAMAGGAKFKMDQVAETVTGNTARVSFVYGDRDNNNALGMGFDLSKENGSWKIDNLAENVDGRGTEGLGQSSPSPVESPKEESEPPPPIPPSNSSSSPSPASPHAPISGGVLNAKALSLPPPAYPPVARAAKASGTVMVQVTVDENGNVVEARAISGHPLLQAAAVAAAHSAKFSPTKLAGQPVKVKGLITYTFTPPQ